MNRRYRGRVPGDADRRPGPGDDERFLRRDVDTGLVRLSDGPRGMLLDADRARARKIRRLRQHLGINTAGIEVVLRLVAEIDELRAHLREMGDTPTPRPPHEWR